MMLLLGCIYSLTVGAEQSSTQASLKELIASSIAGLEAPSTMSKLISVSASHACQIHRSGAAQCWGENLKAELGVGERSIAPIQVAIEVVPPLPTSDLAGVSTGEAHSCAWTKSSGDLYCWGYTYGMEPTQVLAGNGSSNPLSVLQATSLEYATCAITKDDLQIKCWGANSAGKCGVGYKSPIVNEPTPIAAPQGVQFKQVVSMFRTACGLATSGDVYCWGEYISPTPTLVKLPRPAVAGSAGASDQCALVDNGELYCWSSGVNAEKVENAPTYIQSIVVGKSAVYALLMGSGEVMGWGLGSFGKGGEQKQQDSPVVVTRETPGEIVGLACAQSSDVCCIRYLSKASQCWGENVNSLLGDGKPTPYGASRRLGKVTFG